MLERQSDSAAGSVSERLSPDVAQLAGIFATVFELEVVGPDDDFFALGGDSLIATELVSEIERLTGVGLSISVLTNATTPRLLAAALVDRRRKSIDRVLIPVRAAGHGPTLFSVHGMGEDLLTHRLAEVLNQDRPMWTFRPKGVSAGERPVTSIPAMADRYIAAVRTVQPKGPYLIMGHCGAGTFAAWEMARKLAESGNEVAGLVLMEPPTSEDKVPFLHISGSRLETARSVALQVLHKTFAWLDSHPEAPLQARRAAFDILMKAIVASYTPQPISCPTLLICRRMRTHVTLNPRNGYQTMLANVRVVIAEGTHREVLGERLGDSVPEIRAFLDRVAPIGSAATAGLR